jgi:transcriptional regulator with XRE-family HTH domain
MQTDIGSKIRELRELNGFSQEQLAQILEVSRPTYAQLEAGNRKIKAEELKKVAEIFDTTVDFLLAGEDIKPKKVRNEMKKEFKNLILYILNKVGAKYNVGKVVLYKLLYFAEFDYYELTQEHISGYPFIRLPMGPAPLGFNQLIEEMEDDKSITPVITPFGNYYQQRYIPNKEAGTNLSIDQKKCIEEVLTRYSDCSAAEISALSHDDKPWQMAKDMEPISYEFVKYREYPFSPIERLKQLEQNYVDINASGIFSDLAQESNVYANY